MTLFKEIFKKEEISPRQELPAIPKESVEGWKEIPVQECGEKLVPLGAFSQFSDCDTSAVYFGERGKNDQVNFLGQAVDREKSLITHFVRENVLEKIKTAQSLLPEGYYFRFFDNFRPIEVQQALYDAQKKKFQQEHPDWNETKLEKETQKYVSLPSPNKKHKTTHPSPHSTGGVVDLTIIKINGDGLKLLKELESKKQNGELNYPVSHKEIPQQIIVNKKISEDAVKNGWNKNYIKIVQESWLEEYRYTREKAYIFKNFSSALNMGTDFDHFGPEAATRYFEDTTQKEKLTDNEKEAMQNRRFFYQIMKKAGFSNYPEEWWHWSFGDNMEAANTGKKHAIYGGIKMSQKNIDFENARRGPYFNAINRIGKKGLFINQTEDDPT